MADILLISPPLRDYSQKRRVPLRSSQLEVIPPLGLLYNASSLKDAGFKVNVIDMEVDKLGFNSLDALIRKTHPRIIGVNCTTPIFSIVQQITRIIKRIDSSIFTLLGGHHPTILPGSVLKEQSIDFLIRGEGEFAIIELMEAIISSPQKFTDIRGLSYKNNGHPIHNPDRPVIEDLNEIPFPDRTMLPYRKYFSAAAKENPCTSMITSRGCPYKCIFCSNIFPRPRFRSAQNIVDEIELILDQLHLHDIEFLDSTFNLKKQLVLDVCHEIIQRKLDFSFRCVCRVDLIDKEILQWLKAAGCYLITYGVESGSDRVLKILQKGFSVSKVEHTFKITKEVGLETHGLFMVGTPGETRQEIKDTIDFSKKLDPTYAQFFITVPLPGAKLFDMALENKWLKEKEFYDIIERNYSDILKKDVPPMKFPSLTQKEISHFHKRASQQFFLRFRYILKFLAKIMKEPRRFINNIFLVVKYLLV
jgi:anaerobic magnesium-protoporphyrin IX monomethyl ester cyclase